MITLLVVHIFSTALVSAHYQINKDFIAKNLCENRTKPKMNCNGKCHLKKTMKRLDGEKTESKSIQLSISEYIDTPALHIQAGFVSFREKDYQEDNLHTLFSGFTVSIFRPPLV